MKMNTDLTNVYKKYKGMWVALDGTLTKVISANKNAKKVYDEAISKGYKKPTLFKVPQQNILIFGNI